MALLYVSAAKLAALPAHRTLLSRLTGSLKLGVPPVSGEITISSPTQADATEQVARFERWLKGQVVPDAATLATGVSPALFRFDGKSVHVAIDGGFWVAGISGVTGFLLAGSSDYAIGRAGPPIERDLVFSPSVDVVGAMRRLIDLDGGPRAREPHHPLPEGQPEASMDYLWDALIERRAGPTVASLPRLRGVAIYVDTTASGQRSVIGQAPDQSVARIVIGSPYYVEQVPG